MVNRYKISIEYEGTSFFGWQKQDKMATIQGCIEGAIFNLSGEKVEVFGAGRTDTGVHAIAQVAHFDLSKKFEERRIREGLNYHLKNHKISIFDVEELGENSSFHARFSAKKRSYVYKIIKRNYPPVLDKDRFWWVRERLDIDSMKEVCDLLIGKHDFSTFRASGCQASTPIRTIDKLEIRAFKQVEYQSHYSDHDDKHGFNINEVSNIGIGRFQTEKLQHSHNHLDPHGFSERITSKAELEYNHNHEFIPENSLGVLETKELKSLPSINKFSNHEVDKLNISDGNFIIEIYIEAQSFLYHQVRNIVGSLYYVGCGKWNVNDFKKAFESRDRKQGGITAPACGLYFHSVRY